jgi:hypothetical protein
VPAITAVRIAILIASFAFILTMGVFLFTWDILLRIGRRK